MTVALLCAAGAMVLANTGTGQNSPPLHRAQVVWASVVMNAPVAEAGPPGDTGCAPGQDPGGPGCDTTTTTAPATTTSL
ncbi:MAG: hypothetical protein ACRDZ3_20205, partial [Acidimicrobiia bacterium]